MVRAVQFIDFNNPVSLHYAKISIQSFQCVSDILEIEQIQCDTPETMSDELKFDQEKKRSNTEKAILSTYRRLMDRLAHGESFIMMEHDAYLLPKRENKLRYFIETMGEYDIWCPGTAMEFHTCTPEIAWHFVTMLDNDFLHKYKGPMSLYQSTDVYKKNKKVLWPVAGENRRSGVSRSIRRANQGNGSVHSCPVTQCIDEKLGNTQDNSYALTRHQMKNLFLLSK